MLCVFRIGPISLRLVLCERLRDAYDCCTHSTFIHARWIDAIGQSRARLRVLHLSLSVILSVANIWPDLDVPIPADNTALQTAVDTCASLVSMSGQWVLRNKDSGLVRAVFHPFSELMVNQLVLLLIIWPGADCYYEKLITAVTVLVISQQWYFVCEFVWCPYFDYICVCMQPCCQIRVYWTHVYRSMKRSMYRWSSDEEKE